MKLQKIDIWRSIKMKRERLKGVFIRANRRFMSNLEER